MEILTILPVNLQQGFLLAANNLILGAYSHHNKKIYANQRALKKEELPEPFKKYTLIHQVDHFSIKRWTKEKGDTDI